MTGLPLDVEARLVVLLALEAYRDVLFLRIIVSLLEGFAGFTPPSALRPAMNFLYDITEPFLRLFRGLLPAARLGGLGLDFSPILAFLVLYIVQRVAAQVLF